MVSFRSIVALFALVAVPSMCLAVPKNLIRQVSSSTSTCKNLEAGAITADLEIVATYSWGANQTDVDTSTTFLGENVGRLCSGAPSRYLTFSGDNTAASGSETVVISAGQAFLDGSWVEAASIIFRADWFGSVDEGPAILTVSTRNRSGPMGDGQSIVINPGVGRSCAERIVATGVIDDTGKVTLIRAIGCE